MSQLHLVSLPMRFSGLEKQAIRVSSVMESAQSFEAPNVSVEALFADALEKFQLDTNQNKSPFEIIAHFKSITASQALRVGELLTGVDTNTTSELLEEFENWDLETKLWDLVEILSLFRVSTDYNLIEECEFSSLAIKQENHLRKNPQLRELALIIQWLQNNSRSLGTSEDVFTTKWEKTKLAIETRDIKSLVTPGDSDKDHELVDYLDVDAPLRSAKRIHPQDENVDDTNFRVIYKLLLASKVKEAIEFSNNTGNYALALILVGATEDYYDPIIDKLPEVENDPAAEELKASGIRHKLLWKKTVYKLSQRTSLNKFERLIYNFLSGGDITLNILEANGDWEECLLLYTSQLFNYQLEKFIVSNLTSGIESVPPPQFTKIDDILDALLTTGTETQSGGGNHPLRVVAGGVMIDQVSVLLHNIIASIDINTSDAVMKPFLVRVVTHLTIFQMMISGPESINVLDVTTIITLYVSRLSDYSLLELIPIYLAFVPKEEDAREIYSLFLTSITDHEQRMKQIEISKRLGNRLTVDDNDIVMVDDTLNTKLLNVLRRTVERVMTETESYYRPKDVVTVQETDLPVDSTDYKLYTSLEWFYDNNMYEDAIIATITVTRRFLLTGRLVSLREFAREKNFKKLIRDYDAEHQMELLTNDKHESQVTEDHKLELLEYASLVEGLVLISDWKKFYSSQKAPLWENTSVAKLIEKVTKLLNDLLFNWFTELLKHESVIPETKAIFKEFRVMYVPNLLMELLDIYQSARLKDWQYMKDALDLVNKVADEEHNDFLKCFVSSQRLDEFLVKVGEISVVSVEKGMSGLFDEISKK